MLARQSECKTGCLKPSGSSLPPGRSSRTAPRRALGRAIAAKSRQPKEGFDSKALCGCLMERPDLTGLRTQNDAAPSSRCESAFRRQAGQKPRQRRGNSQHPTCKAAQLKHLTFKMVIFYKKPCAKPRDSMRRVNPSRQIRRETISMLNVRCM